jgi:hypothetical protein
VWMMDMPHYQQQQRLWLLHGLVHLALISCI